MVNEVPVVVVGGSLNALGVVRSLSRSPQPFSITVVETTRACPSAWSRLCRFAPVKSLEGRPLIEALRALSTDPSNRPVLILTDDRAVQTVSDFRDEIVPLYRISLPSKEVVRCLLDKAAFQKFAEQNGLPVPKSVLIESASDFPRLGALTLPVVIKPASKAQSLNGNVARAERAETREALSALAERMLADGGSLVVQEWIDGPDTNIFFTLFTCDAQSNPVAFFSGRKIVCDPPRVGNTAVCVSAQEAAPELERLTRSLIELVEYRGLGSLEFKRDERNGRFVIVEPTVGRTDWQEEIATLCGVNLPLLTYKTELSRSASPIQSLNDRVAWRSSKRHGPPKGALADGTQVLGGYFLIHDPLPGIYHYAYERFVGRIFRLFRRMI